MLALLLLGCTGDDSSLCPGWGEPELAGTVADGALDEISGLAASRDYPDVLWAHNDQGDGARVFAMNVTGAARAEVTLSGVLSVDWEDMAIGPGPDGEDWLYIGDIGDNELNRESVAVVRLPEPNPGAGDAVADEVERYTLYYPEGPRDAETLLVDPLGGDLYLLTRPRGGTAEIYRVAADALVDEATLEKVGSLGTEGLDVRGGSVSPDGTRVWLRTDSHVFLQTRSTSESLHEALTGPGCALEGPAETNGEAIAADGTGFFTAGEGEAAPIWRVQPEES